MHKKRAIFILLSISLFLFGCSSSTGENDKPALQMGISADYPPFAFQKNGKINGLEVDLAQAIAQEAGYQIEIQDMDFNGIIPSIKSGRIDMAMSALSVTEERLKNVVFSDEYYRVAPALLLLKNSGISSKDDLVGKTVAAQLGSTLETLANQLNEIYGNITVISAPRTIQLVEELKIGRVQGVLIDSEQAYAFAKAEPKLQVLPLPDEATGWAAAFPLNSPHIDAINQAIRNLKDSGKLDQIINSWADGDGEESFLESIQDVLPSALFIAKGSLITLQYTLISVFFGLLLGVFIALAKVSHIGVIKWFAKAYTSLFRGTPVIVQLSLAYFALPAVTGFQISAFMAGVIAFSLNSAAYVSESIRGGIESVDRGQIEASQALGIPHRLMMKDIILPQAIRNILPALANEIVNLLKETAIISMIGVSDLMRRAQMVAAEKYSFLMPLLVAAACYYIMVLIFSSFAKHLECKFKKS